jgi:hypothetical protein
LALSRVLAAVVCSATAANARAQTDTSAAERASASRPVVRAAHTNIRPRLDGRLDEPSWLTADSITDLRQREPNEGRAASERTVIRVLADDEALYVGVRAFDRDAAHIRSSQLRRDADLTTDDNLTLLIDSFHDRRSAFLFRTNPNGAMWDAQLVGLESTNANWNGIWDVAVARDSAGWTAEFRIPLSTLRFESGAGAAFGFNVRRDIRRRNEEDLWQSWGRAQGLYQLLNEGDLVGFGTLARARHLEVKPYLLSRAVAPDRDVSAERIGDGFVGGKAGVDAKAAVSPTLTADLTVNTDFAQVEADRQVINLTRFPLFFPEKREFFLESSGIFDFGTSQRAQIFYTRRVGLNANGDAVPILGGVRLTGKQGPWSIGLLDARTGAGDDANNFVLRLRHDLLDRAFVGAIVADRSGRGVDRHDVAGGVDVDLPLVVRGHNLEPSFWLAGTRVPGVAGTATAWRAGTDYPNDLFDNFVSLYRIDAGFSPTLGFVRRTGIWETTGHIDYMPRPGILGIRRLDIQAPIPSWDIIADESGSLARPTTWQTAELEWRLLGGSFQSGDEFELNVQRFMDAPADTFEVFEGVSALPGRYWWTRTEVQYQTSEGRPLSAGIVASSGKFYDGHGTELELTTTYRGGGHVILGADLTRQEASLSAGHFLALSAGSRIEYALTTRMDFLAFAQYNNESRRADFNLRFHWIPVIGDDVFVVWNSGFTTDPEARFRFPSTRALRRPLNGALVVKAVHRFVP